MITRKSLALVLAVFAILTGTAVYGQFSAGRYTRGESGRIIPKPAQTASTNSTYDAGAYPIYSPLLVPGDGRQEVNVYCNTCHSRNLITMQPPLPAETWAAEVAKMQKSFGADFPDEVTQKIIRYLQANYTPDTRKHSEPKAAAQ